MALNPIIDSRDVRFIMFEQLELDKFCQKYERYNDYDKDTLESTLDLGEKVAVEKIFPTYQEGDKEGCTFVPDTKAVKIPKCYKAALDAYYETGFIGTMEDPEIGGMGMPAVMYMSVNEILCAANYNLMMYPGLSHGAMELVNTFGNQEQKDMYIPKMMSGEWGGTMCLTESDAGSDVGALKTKAIRQPDGTFKITGQKIFISAGDNDYYKNIIHPVLARIEGDPAGTKGISIFIVPKYLVKPDGSLGAHNDVNCAGIEHKMGIKGSATCTLSFGDEGNCIGYLLGEERKGMKIMFQMMNEARLGVGMQGLALASAAYMHSVTYAKNRLQGVHVTQMLNPEAKSVTISQHPDVKRMLLWMKSHIEGMRFITYYLTHALNIAHVAEGEEAKEAMAIAEIMVPINKAGNTDKSVEITAEAMQVYGGYGYCSEYPIEQMMRDSKITAIYEGTNGIQSMDLTMRKILMNPEQYNYTILKKRIQEAVDKAKGVVDDKYVALVERGVQKLDEVITMLKEQMAKGQFLHLFMHATPLQQAMFMLCMAWGHISSLTISQPKMKELLGDKKGEERDKILSDNSEAAYYTGKVLSSQFYLGMEFPKYFGKIEALLFNETAVIKATDPIFTGALEQ
ncbi:MAG: acyl-CoA dehydrogenase [Chrysiogenales bacterium]|nr:MAG: acyl-CoA dehydrogenase [Chrysiogenales bacterium]